MATQQEIHPAPIFSRITAIILITRLITGTGIQIFFPFLPVIATGLGVSEIALGRMLGLRSISALVSPVFGATADKRGYCPITQFALFLAAVGNFTIYFSRSPPGFVAGLIILGIGTAGVTPTLAAYMRHLLPFEQRSRGLGMLEYAWALVGIVALPFFGWLIAGTSWRAPFLVMGVLEIAAIFWFGQLPRVIIHSIEKGAARPSMILLVRDFLDFGDNWRSMLAVLLGDSLVKFSGILLSINFGIWLAKEYGLGAAGLGQAAFFLCFADMGGSGLVGLAGDRLGKRRSVMIATTFGVWLFGTLPLWNWSLILAMVGIFLARWTFEFSIVAHIVLVSEQSPAHRGKAMTMRIGFGFLAVITASVFGPVLYTTFGVWGIAVPGALGMGIAWFVVRFLTVERG